MKTAHIKSEIKNGTTCFGNPSARWAAFVKPDGYWISYNCEVYKKYSTIDGFARRVSQLLNKGV